MTEALPHIRAETHTDAGVTLRLFVPADLSLFSGHFPGFPLLPGVAQIHWAAQLGAAHFPIGGGTSGGFSRLLNIKFQKPVLPDSELDLALNWDAARRQLAFSYHSAAGCHASGKIEFAGERADTTAVGGSACGPNQFSPCFIVPVYNHGTTVGATVAALARHDLPIYLVDDGSEAITATVLDRLATSIAQVCLVRRAANGGKGAAVMSGIRAAFADGRSHACQVDADGQHTLTDIPDFLAAAQADPLALICGVPEYDASVPKGRLYGRYATHVWVWIETLSFAIRDSMCGFRVYPLAATHRLIDQVRLGTRMDFDIEVLVRLFWRGVTIINRPTRVTYPEGGISHFRPLRDNLRISWLHTRLFFGMLWRLPLLLARRLRGA